MHGHPRYMLMACLICFIYSTKSQTPISVTVDFDKDMAGYDIVANYNNGIKVVGLESPDSLKGKRLKIEGEVYLKVFLFSLQITEKQSRKFLYSRAFVLEPPASYISFKTSPYPTAIDSFYLIVDKIDNANESAFSTIPFFINMDSFCLKEKKVYHDTLQEFINNPQRFANTRNDSSFKAICLALYAKQCEYLSQHISNKYAFWFFQGEIVNLGSAMFRGDTVFNNFFRQAYNNIFAATYDTTMPGSSLREQLRANEKLTLNDAMPQFSFKEINGTTTDLHKQTKGKMVLIDFWASWCPPCIKKFPFIQSIYQLYDSSKLTIIGVSLDAHKETVEKAIQRYGLKWTNYHDDLFLFKNKFRVEAIPVLLLFNEAGKLVYNSQLVDDDKLLLKILQEHIGQ